MVNKYGFTGKELEFFTNINNYLFLEKEEDQAVSEKVARIATILFSNAKQHGKDYYRKALQMIHRIYGGSPTIVSFVEKAKLVVKEYLHKLKEVI